MFPLRENNQGVIVPEILELNLRAKKKTVEPVVQAAPPIEGGNSLTVKEGKKYITKSGQVVGPMEIHTGGLIDGVAMFKAILMHVTLPNYWDMDGTFSHCGKGHANSLAREWFETWKEHDVWLAGGVAELKIDKWIATYTAKQVVDMFNTNPTVWWLKYVNGQYTVRIAQ